MVDIPAEQQRQVAGVRFNKVGKLYQFDTQEHPELSVGDFVIVETVRGRQMGQIMAYTAVEDDQQSFRTILRPATPRDLVLQHHWESKQDEALAVCKEKASRYREFNDVKFVAAMYNYDGSFLSLLFTAEDYININRLWKDLSHIFSCEVELRQIGPRDVAKLMGGYGACGALRCCSTFLTDFSPVSIKMAKAQGISLNPSEITGMCGRLRCCLVYEYEQYIAARKTLPRRNKRVGTPFGEARVIDVHPLQDAVTVMTEEGRRLVMREDLIPLDELRALQEKAQSPCSKHGDEPCDCGKEPGERMQDKQATAKLSQEQKETTTAEIDEQPRRRPKRSRSKPSNNQENQNTKADANEKNKRRKRRGRKRKKKPRD